MSVEIVDPTPPTADLGSSPLPNTNAVPVTFENIRYTVKVKKAEKHILDGLSGVMPAGKLTALMGPSGSGKTTLLDVLAGRTRPLHAQPHIPAVCSVSPPPTAGWGGRRPR